MRISDWSSDVCSSDLAAGTGIGTAASLAGQPRASGWLSGSFAACTSITLTVRHGRGQGLAIHREVYAGVSFGGYDVLRGRISCDLFSRAKVDFLCRLDRRDVYALATR